MEVMTCMVDIGAAKYVPIRRILFAFHYIGVAGEINWPHPVYCTAAWARTEASSSHQLKNDTNFGPY